MSAVAQYLAATMPTSDLDAPWCRGCGGTGIASHVHPRLVEAARKQPSLRMAHTPGYRSTPPGVSVHNPAIAAIHRWDEMIHGGWVDGITGNKPDFILDGSHLCQWCYGTGRRRPRPTPEPATGV